MQKNSNGLRKNSMILFMIGLVVALVVLFRGIAKAAPNNIPEDLRSALRASLSANGYGGLDNWLAVSKMETAGFTSSLYRVANNPWGMGFPKIRPTTASGVYVGKSNNVSSLKFANYPNLPAACDDLVLWMNYFKFPKDTLTLDNHIKEMSRIGYFGTESYASYLSKVKAWLTR